MIPKKKNVKIFQFEYFLWICDFTFATILANLFVGRSSGEVETERQ